MNNCLYFIFSVAGEPPCFETHASLEAQFDVRVGFPVVDGNRVVKLIGTAGILSKVLVQLGRILEGQVTPVLSPKKKKSSVDRDKKFYCLYCEKGLKFRISEHCFTQHPNETLVMETLRAPVKSAMRKKLMAVSFSEFHIYISNFLMTCF